MLEGIDHHVMVVGVLGHVLQLVVEAGDRDRKEEKEKCEMLRMVVEKYIYKDRLDRRAMGSRRGIVG